MSIMVPMVAPVFERVSQCGSVHRETGMVGMGMPLIEPALLQLSPSNFQFSSPLHSTSGRWRSSSALFENESSSSSSDSDDDEVSMYCNRSSSFSDGIECPSSPVLLSWSPYPSGSISPIDQLPSTVLSSIYHNTSPSSKKDKDQTAANSTNSTEVTAPISASSTATATIITVTQAEQQHHHQHQQQQAMHEIQGQADQDDDGVMMEVISDIETSGDLESAVADALSCDEADNDNDNDQSLPCTPRANAMADDSPSPCIFTRSLHSSNTKRHSIVSVGDCESDTDGEVCSRGSGSPVSISPLSSYASSTASSVAPSPRPSIFNYAARRASTGNFQPQSIMQSQVSIQQAHSSASRSNSPMAPKLSKAAKHLCSQAPTNFRKQVYQAKQRRLLSDALQEENSSKSHNSSHNSHNLSRRALHINISDCTLGKGRSGSISSSSGSSSPNRIEPALLHTSLFSPSAFRQI